MWSGNPARHRPSPTVALIPILFGLSAGMLCNPSVSFAKPKPKPKPMRTVDPAALRLIHEMVGSYEHLKQIDQTTTYKKNTGTGPNPVESVHLLFNRPNRFMVEAARGAPGSKKPLIYQWLSNGKQLYYYDGAQNWYRVSKAPRNPKKLAFDNMTIEFAAILGQKPFRNIRREVQELQYLGRRQIGDNWCDVVVAKFTYEGIEGVAHFFLGEKHHLIRRFDFTAGNTGPAETPPSGQPAFQAAPIIQIAYENTYNLSPKFSKGAFDFEPPAGAMLDEPITPLQTKNPRKWPVFHYKPPKVAKPISPKKPKVIYP